MKPRKVIHFDRVPRKTKKPQQTVNNNVDIITETPVTKMISWQDTLELKQKRWRKNQEEMEDHSHMFVK